MFAKRWHTTESIGVFDMPARIIRPSHYSVTGWVASHKNATSQQSESTLEHDLLTILEFDPRVEKYGAQPITIRWIDKTGKSRRYTPDVMVKYSYLAKRDDPSLKTTLIEVKPQEVLSREWGKLRSRFAFATSWARAHDMRFKIMTDKKIRTPYLENARFLLRYRHLPNNPSVSGHQQLLIRKTLFDLKEATPRDLLNRISESKAHQAELVPWIWQLINAELIGADLTQRLTMSSRIWTRETAGTLGVDEWQHY
jgi:hypothetical protein